MVPCKSLWVPLGTRKKSDTSVLFIQITQTFSMLSTGFYCIIKPQNETSAQYIRCDVISGAHFLIYYNDFDGQTVGKLPIATNETNEFQINQLSFDSIFLILWKLRSYRYFLHSKDKRRKQKTSTLS